MDKMDIGFSDRQEKCVLINFRCLSVHKIKENGATIMTSIRHLCMNLFQQEPSTLSLAKKKRKAAWSDAFRTKVMFSSDF